MSSYLIGADEAGHPYQEALRLSKACEGRPPAADHPEPRCATRDFHRDDPMRRLFRLADRNDLQPATGLDIGMQACHAAWGWMNRPHARSAYELSLSSLRTDPRCSAHVAALIDAALASIP